MRQQRHLKNEKIGKVGNERVNGRVKGKFYSTHTTFIYPKMEAEA